MSTGYWEPDIILTRGEYNGRVKYCYDSPGSRWILPYVGCAEPLDRIPQGTLLRVSLARWWRPDDSDFELRCYLQLSGWYLN